MDRGADYVDLALVGGEITHPRHTPPPFNNRKGGAEIRVLPFGQWTKDAMTALNMANFDLVGRRRDPP